MVQLCRAVEQWEPRTETVAVHAWLHPWLPYLGSRMDELYPNIRFKLSSALQQWHPSDQSALALLRPWHTVRLRVPHPPVAPLHPLLLFITSSLGPAPLPLLLPTPLSCSGPGTWLPPHTPPRAPLCVPLTLLSTLLPSLRPKRQCCPALHHFEALEHNTVSGLLTCHEVLARPELCAVNVMSPAKTDSACSSNH